MDNDERIRIERQAGLDALALIRVLLFGGPVPRVDPIVHDMALDLAMQVDKKINGK